MAFVSPFLDVSPGVVMSAALALVVNDAAVSEQRTMVLIGGGKFAEG
jgi:hypothetical protein